MTIFGSAKLFSIYTSEKVFNGQVAIKISTDGKILVIGQLNFAADNLSLSARLYANLTKISQGEGTILLLVKVPDQVDLLTIKGSLKFGFRDILGEEVEFGVTYDSLDKPYQALSGITQGSIYGLGGFNNVGYIDVNFNETPSLGTLNADSITDLDAEIVLFNTDATVNSAISPVELSLTPGIYRIWLSNVDVGVTSVDYGFIFQSWSFTDTDTNEVVFSDRGSVSDPSDPIPQFGSEDVTRAPFIDVNLIPELGGAITPAALAEIVANGTPLITVRKDGIAVDLTIVEVMALDDDTVRFLFDPDSFVVGDYTVSFNEAFTNNGLDNLITEDVGFTVAAPRIACPHRSRRRWMARPLRLM